MPDQTTPRACVETVLGPVPVTELGVILPHEHLQWGESGHDLDVSGRVGRIDRTALGIELLQQAHHVGVRTIFDPTTPEMGRDLDLMAEASQASGVHVVAATGVYAASPTPYFVHRTSTELTELMVSELRHGSGPEHRKPAFVKLAIGHSDFTPHEATCLEAAAAAHAELNTPILIHCEPWVGESVLRRLVTELGVDGAAVVVGHAEGVSDLRHHLELIDTYGAFVGFDRFGLQEFDLRDDVRIGLVAALIALGRERSLHLAHDVVACWMGRGQQLLDTFRGRNPNWRITYLHQEVLPQLEQAGVPPEVLMTITTENPLRWLTRG